MARITVEDCLAYESNRFSLVRLTARRAKQILMGDHTVADDTDNKAIVSALREIAEGKVEFQPTPQPVVISDEAGVESTESVEPSA